MDFATPESLHKTISSALKVSVETTGLPCTRAQELGSDFLTKNTMVSLTTWNIVNPKNIKEFPSIRNAFQIYDFPSAYVLIRTLFEGYINMYYILIDPVSEEEREFRLDLWDRHGLLERQKMGGFIGSQQRKLAAEKKQIEAYTKSIVSSGYFKSLPERERQSCVDMHRWTKLDTIQRAARANIHRSQSQFIFKFCSNYAHSESFALMQIHSVRDVREAERIIRIPMRFTEMFLSLTLRLFAKLQPVAESLVEEDRSLVYIMDFWGNMKTRDFRELLTNNTNTNRE